MKIESTLLAPDRNIFQQARRDKNVTDPTEKGLQQAMELLAQYGNSRQVVVAGDAAVALSQRTFGEMVQKFGAAKEVKEGIYVFNAAGSNLMANWYTTMMEDRGVRAADKNKDGLISNHESFSTKRMIDFDAQGRVFFSKPRKGEVTDNDEIFRSINDIVERAIAADTNKDGITTSAELKEKRGINLDRLREETMAARGLNPDGTWALPPIEDQEFDYSGLSDQCSESETEATGLQRQLRDVERQIGELHGREIDEDEGKLRELQATEQRLLKQLAKADGYRPVSEKA